MTSSTRSNFVEYRKTAFDAIFPPRCVGGVKTSRDCHIWSRDLFCAACATTLQKLESKNEEMPLCDCCGAPMRSAHAAVLCTDCRDNRYHQSPPFDAARSVYDYVGAIASAIHRFKYDGKTALSQPLAGLLIEFLRTSSTRCCAPDELDFVVPVPLHRWRQWRRGFNQSELLAREIGRSLNIPSHEIVRRTRFAPPQVVLSREERQQNVKNVFQLRDGFDVQNKTVLLIDDVYTTGATLKECAQVLKNGGAEKVYALTLARAL